jgi:hypothetical protein
MRTFPVILSMVALTLAAACNEEEPPDEMVIEEAVLPDGTVIVTAMTEGNDTISSYTVRTDGTTAAGIVSDQVPLVIGALPAGPHSLELVNIPAGCAIQGENPRNVQITAGDTTRIRFAIECD